VTTEFNVPLATVCITAGRYFAITKFTPQFSDSDRENNEFFFVIDCSGSMRGRRIEQARECLSLFIRSLPANSFFNIVRFGSRFEALFPEAVNYNKETSKHALGIAKKMEANFGGTEIYGPLSSIFLQPRKGTGLRQLFVITDGEVSNTDRVLELARSNSVSNRCFAIGLGSGADAGLVQGIADGTGGRADFVSDHEDLTGKVIGQLETSLRGSLINVAIEVSDVDGIEFAPFPIPPISSAVAQTVFGGCQNPLGQVGILISGDLLGERIDEVVESHEAAVGEEVLKALFAYETIRNREARLRNDPKLRMKIIQLSIESGVLCRETAFVGCSNEVFRIERPYQREAYHCYAPTASAPSLGLVPSMAAPPSLFMDSSPPVGMAGSPMACMSAPPSSSQAADSSIVGSIFGSIFRFFKRDDNPKSTAPPPRRPPPPTGAAMSREKVDAPVKSSDQMLALIGLQKVEGSWSDIQAIQNSCGIRVKCPPELNGKPDVFATALAIAILRKRFSDRESQWKMIERKGLRWLNTQGIDSERIITELVSLC
jgi:hypothetical protein